MESKFKKLAIPILAALCGYLLIVTVILAIQLATIDNNLPAAASPIQTAYAAVLPSQTAVPNVTILLTPPPPTTIVITLPPAAAPTPPLTPTPTSTSTTKPPIPTGALIRTHMTLPAYTGKCVLCHG